MTVARIKIALDQEEYSALLDAGENDLRNAESQARFFIRKELERRGFLHPRVDQPTVSQPESDRVGE